MASALGRLSFRIQPDRFDRAPIAGFARPPFWMLFTRGLIDRVGRSIRSPLSSATVARLECHEADGAVAMLGIVPAHEVLKFCGRGLPSQRPFVSKLVRPSDHRSRSGPTCYDGSDCALATLCKSRIRVRYRCRDQPVEGRFGWAEGRFKFG